MSTYKLYYFNVRGTAEPIRIIFAQAGVKYDDVRFELGEQWAKEYKQSKMTLSSWMDYLKLVYFLKRCHLDVRQIWTLMAQ